MVRFVKMRRWELHTLSKNKAILAGLENNTVKTLDNELTNKLKQISYNGISASSLLLLEKTNVEVINIKSILVADALLNEDISLVYAQVDTLCLNPMNEGIEDYYNEICFVEKRMDNNKTLVYDPLSNLIFDGRIYYDIEKPQIKKVYCSSELKLFLEKEKDVINKFTSNINYEEIKKKTL